MRNFTKRVAFLIGMVGAMVLINSGQIVAQCLFNCNDTIHVSVNNNCMATITPDLMLEGADSVTCEYAIEIFQADGVTLVTIQPDVGMSEVGMTLKVRVFENGNPNGPSCWGYIKVEDKLPPPLECAGNDTIPCFLTDPYFTNVTAAAELASRIQANIIDNCGDETMEVLILANDLDRQYCLDGFSAFRRIQYEVFDNDRNVLSCTDSIYYEQIPLDTLNLPKNYINNMVLDCNDPYPSVAYLLDRDGDISIPNFNGTALSEYRDSAFYEKDAILCNFKMTYSDIVFPTCGATFKIVREWIVIDWCNSNFPESYNQIIKVQDNDLSIASGCSDINGQVADPETCLANVELPVPTVSSNECSEYTYAILVKGPSSSTFELFGSAARNTTSGPVSRDFLLGISMVKYLVTDACNNVDSCTFQVEVVDEEAPTAVCDYRTVITLTDSFLGKARALSFDDGSFDICSGITKFDVRRVDRDNTGCETPSDFDPFVKFCCEDIGKTILVEFRVTDGVGLTSTCITEAVIQFKGDGPVITCPASPSNADCGQFDSYNLNKLTAPTISSDNPCIANNLTSSIRETSRAIDNCGNGFIAFEWFINITGEEEVVCQGQVNFENQNIFTEANINWPANREALGCNNTSPLDSEISNLIPVIGNCNNVVASDPVDRVFDNVSGVCSRIVRTWTVVDWCRYPADPAARWTYEQTITVSSSMPPVINESATAPDIVHDNANCRAEISAVGTATDDCTNVEDLIWSYAVLQDGIEIIPSGSGNAINTVLPMGNFEIRWNVEDDCGNSSTYTEAILIDDTQAPQLMCASFDLPIDSTTQDAIVTVAEFGEGSFDNCDAAFEMGIRRANSGDALAQLLRLTCQELGPVEIELVATDAAGNISSCTGFVNVLNNIDVCKFGASLISLSGEIRTESNIPIEEVEVSMMDMNHSDVQTEMTDVNGYFGFQGMEPTDAYRLESAKIDDYRNGLSTADIIKIQNHILGLKDLDSPYKYLAADVNGNGSISALDLLLIRRIILQQIDEFPDEPAWKFVDRSIRFDLPSDIWNYNRTMDLVAGQENVDMIGIKMGDVTADAIANSAIAGGRNVQSYSIVENIKRIDGFIVVELLAGENMISPGVQLGIDFNNENYTLSKVESDIWNIETGMVHEKLGQINISISSTKEIEIQGGDHVLRFYFKATHDGGFSFNVNNDNLLRAEIYDSELVPHRIHILRQEIQREVLLHQNRPNPFTDQTLVEFALPERQTAEFSIFDLNGKSVFHLNQLFVQGLNQIKISKDGLGLNKGIYYYQIRTRDGSLVKKMILL